MARQGRLPSRAGRLVYRHGRAGWPKYTDPSSPVRLQIQNQEKARYRACRARRASAFELWHSGNIGASIFGGNGHPLAHLGGAAPSVRRQCAAAAGGLGESCPGQAATMHGAHLLRQVRVLPRMQGMGIRVFGAGRKAGACGGTENAPHRFVGDAAATRNAAAIGAVILKRGSVKCHLRVCRLSLAATSQLHSQESRLSWPPPPPWGWCLRHVPSPT